MLNRTDNLTRVEKLIAAVSPTWALRRQTDRLRLDALASYRGSSAGRLGTGFTRSEPINGGSFIERWQAQSMRDRAYNVYANNPIAKSVLNTETNNVVADGLQFRSLATDAKGKVTKKIKAFRAECTEKWETWLNQADVYGMFNGSDLQRKFYNNARRFGDGGMILVSQNGFSYLQHVTSRSIETPPALAGNPYVIDGVEVNTVGRPIAYHVIDLDAFGKRTYLRVPANNFVYFAPGIDDDELSRRGVTCYTTVFDYLDQLSGYIDGVVTAARLATVFGLIYKSDAGAAASGRAEGPRIAGSGGGGPDRRAVTMHNGQFAYVGGKDEYVQVDAKQPMQQTPAFIRELLRMIGLPFDMPLELIGHNLAESSFASARIGLNQYYRSCYGRQRSYKEHWSRIFRWWISREQKKKAVDYPGCFVNDFPDLYFPHAMHCRAWQYTDPVSEAQGDHLQMSMGVKSEIMVAAERGYNYEQVVEDQAAAALMRLKKLLPPTPFSSLTRDYMGPAVTGEPPTVGGAGAAAGAAGSKAANDKPDDDKGGQNDGGVDDAKTEGETEGKNTKGGPDGNDNAIAEAEKGNDDA